VDERAPPARHRGADVELVPERARVERIATEQHLPQPAIHRVHARRLDARARDPRIEVRLADPDDALVGDDLDDDRVLRRARRARVVRGVEEDVRADVDDPHYTRL